MTIKSKYVKFKCTLQFVVTYGITRGNTPVGVLPHDT